MKIIQKYEGWLLAKSPIHHGGNEKTGSTPVLRTIYLYVDGMGEIPFPYLHGNAIRGKLRRLIMKDFLELLGFEVDKLPVKLYHTFFTGGVLESTEDNYATIDLKMRTEIRDLIIPLAVFGCAIGNQMIPGILKVGHAFPICKEYYIYLPEQYKQDERVNKNVKEFTDESFHTRKDDLKADREKDEQAQQMKVDYECFGIGTKFYHWFSLEWATELEKSCFGRVIELFRKSPFVGGKSSTGDGEVSFDYRPQISDSKAYISFVESNKDLLIELIAKLGKGK